ncbi:molybdopterin dinucleotide binding domain-containing protein, partial [Acinetobacter baumannii]|uniref:molybdopterin dinucleotide binding domain-containing protein n=1 Tax=Acinetobacter baumannii TaxID=470 RepID=UPI0024B6ADB7
FENREFFTPDRKARFIAVTPRAAVNATSRDYPLVLHTGRIRDQWHTMTRTGTSARLMAPTFEPSVEFHPDDARQAGVNDGALARLTSPWGEM